MSDTIEMPVLVADVAGIPLDGGIVYVHDFALDGDEELFEGRAVRVDPGYGTLINASVISHDEKAGFWYLRLEAR